MTCPAEGATASDWEVDVETKLCNMLQALLCCAMSSLK